MAPYADPVYRRLRPTIALPAPRGGARDAALDLDGYFGLHPSLEPLLPLWKDGMLAAVQAVGSPNPRPRPAVRPEKNGSNMCSATVGVGPGPLSSTAIEIR